MLQTSPDIFAVLGEGGKTVQAYFETFNRGQFAETSQLFAPEGCLHPPFEDPVRGSEAIAQYLFQEAQGMEANPIQADLSSVEGEPLKISVKGKVTAIVFKVNVVWDFILNSHHQITSVRINLRASLEELLKIRPA